METLIQELLTNPVSRPQKSGSNTNIPAPVIAATEQQFFPWNDV